MVVLFVTPFYYDNEWEMPKGGGLNMYLYRVTRSLVQLGHTPIIISMRTKNDHYIKDGIEVFYVRYLKHRFVFSKLNLLYDMLCAGRVINRKIKDILRERKIDIIQFASAWGLASGYYGKTPAVMRLSMYTKVYRDYKAEKIDKLETDITAFVERLAAKRCNAVYAPSNVIADVFSEAIHRPVSVIETPFWNESGDVNNRLYDERLKGKKYVLHYGRLTVDKGILVIAETLHAFLETNPEYYFVCCGMPEKLINGESAVNILKKAAGEYQNRFIFIKSVPHQLLYPIIQHAEFVVLPAIVDNLPNACLEAMYFERVVIGSDGASHEQVIEDEINGLLSIPNDASSFLEKMNEAVAMNREQKEEMGRLARKRIDELAPEHIIKKLIRYYEHIVDRTGN